MSERHLINQRIIQNIVNAIFEEQGKLIGEGGYLSEGLDENTITELQINALIKAQPPNAAKYKQKVQQLFLDYSTHRYVFQYLVFPSANSASNYFGADFLHEILVSQPSAFEREQNWLGGDRYGMNKDSKLSTEYDIESIIDPYRKG